MKRTIVALEGRLTPLLAALVVAAGPRVLVLALDPVGVEATLAKSIDPLVAGAAGAQGADVVSEADLQQLAEIEANKAAMGCDTSSCLAELAGAMGAELVLYGSVSQLGTSTVVTLSLFDSKATSIRRDVLTTSDLGTLPDEIPPRVKKLMLEARPVLANRAAAAQPLPPEATDAEPPTDGLPWLAIGVLAGGGALVVGGGALAIASELTAQQASLPGDEKAAAQLRGRIGIGVAAVGVAVAVAGGVLLAVGGE